MDDDYYEVTAELDAREILRYLNNLGIHNISGEVLKYFITGLYILFYIRRIIIFYILLGSVFKLISFTTTTLRHNVLFSGKYNFN